MLHPSTKRLIDKLIEMTEASKITWLEGEDGTCIYDTEGYRVTIGQAPSRVVLLDAGGRVLETVSESILANTTDSNGMQYTLRVDNLVSTARRQITGATDVIDRIVSALELDKEKKPDRKSKDKAVPATPRPEVTFPDQPEMASRVAMLAAKVNGVPPEEEAVEDEVLELDDVGATDESDDAMDIPPVADPVIELSRRESLSGLSVGAIGLAAVGAGVDDGSDELVIDDEPETQTKEDYDSGSPWSVPDAAAEASGETVEDYFDSDDDQDFGFAPAAREPLPAVDDQPELLSEATASEPMPDEAFDNAPAAQLPRPDILTSATFGAIGAFGTVGASAVEAIGEDEAPESDEWIASEKSSVPLSPVETTVSTEPEVEPPKAVLHAGPAMEGLSITIDATKVTPLEYTMPNVMTVEVSEIEAYLAEEAAAAASMPAMQLPPTAFLSRTIMAAAHKPPEAAPSPVEDAVEFVDAVEEVVVEPQDDCSVIEAEVTHVEADPVMKTPPEPEPEPEPELRGGRRTVYKYNPWM